MKGDLFYLIFRDKPAKVLISLSGSSGAAYASGLAKAADCTYPHIVKILAEFKKHGLILVSSRGRIKPVVLTSKGRKIAAKLKELELLLGQY